MQRWRGCLNETLDVCRAGSAEARKPFPAEGTTSDAMLMCGHPVDQQKSGAAADLQSPPAGQAAETAAAQALATDAAPVAVPSNEENGTGAQVIPQLSSAEPSRMAAASHSVNVQQDIRTPQGQCHGVGAEIEEQAAELVSTQAASDPMSATFSNGNAPVSVASQPQLPSAEQSENKQSPAGLQSSPLVSGNGMLDMQSGCTDVGSADASAAAPPFIQSPRTGVVRAIHSSPASPVDDMIAQQRPVCGAQLGIGKKYVASPLGPSPQQQTCCHTDGKPALVPGSAGIHAQAHSPSLEEQLGKPACSVQSRNLQSPAAAPAAGDSEAQPTARGIQVAIREKESAREADPLGSSSLEGAQQMEEAACAATSSDNAKVCRASTKTLFTLALVHAPICCGFIAHVFVIFVLCFSFCVLAGRQQRGSYSVSQQKRFVVQEDASMPEAVEVRWVPSPEWTNPGEAPGEQPMANGDSALAPLLGSLPWPFPTLYPSTPEREAQPQRPRDALDAPQPTPPNLLDTHSAAPLPPVKSSMQPVFLLEDGEPSLLGAAALPSPAVLTPPSNAAPPLPSASLVPLLTRKSFAGSIGTLNGPPDSVSPCEPAPQLPAAAETRAPAGIAGQESVTIWGVGGHSVGGATSNMHEAAGLTIGSQTPHDSVHSHPSSAEPASEHPHERYQPHHSSENDRDGKRPSYSDRDRRNDSREQERADEKLGELGEKRYERTRDRDRQGSVRDHDARRERQQDHAREYSSRTESADGDRRREHKQGPLRSTSRERDRPARRAHEDARLAIKRDDRGDYNDRYRDRDGRGRNDSRAERHVESGHRSREGSRPDDRIKDPPRSPWHDGLRKQKPREVERESIHGVNRRGPGQPRSRSGTHELALPDDSCPFEAGRVIGCRCCPTADC